LDAGVAEPQGRDGPTRLTRVGLGGDRVVRDPIALSATTPKGAQRVADAWMRDPLAVPDGELLTHSPRAAVSSKP
jgi:hypothetical protein